MIRQEGADKGIDHHFGDHRQELSHDAGHVHDGGKGDNGG